MKSVVVYESHWGNTAAVARAIAEGLGDGSRALTTDEATGPVIADAELIVAGAPVMAFRLASDGMLAGIKPGEGEPEPDLTHPSMRNWLGRLPHGAGHGAAFETRLRWSPGGASGAIERGLRTAGYGPVAKARKFVVTGKTGPLREGEIEAARAWGAELAKLLETQDLATAR
jgi:hypothetical protein